MGLGSGRGRLRDRNGHRRSAVPRYSLGDRIQYTVEIPGHGSVWNVELQRSLSNPRLEFNPDPADAERRTRMVVDALMAYDQT